MYENELPSEVRSPCDFVSSLARGPLILPCKIPRAGLVTLSECPFARSRSVSRCICEVLTSLFQLPTKPACPQQSAASLCQVSQLEFATAGPLVAVFTEVIECGMPKGNYLSLQVLGVFGFFAYHPVRSLVFSNSIPVMSLLMSRWPPYMHSIAYISYQKLDS